MRINKGLKWESFMKCCMISGILNFLLLDVVSMEDLGIANTKIQRSELLKLKEEKM